MSIDFEQHDVSATGGGVSGRAADWIRVVGRGREGARALPRGEAQAVCAALLDGQLDELETGALLLAYRIKGESAEEMAGFLDAVHARLPSLLAPAVPYAPVLLPSYNGTRRHVHLTALLACALARSGVPVLVHGPAAQPGRVHVAEVLAALGVPPVTDLDQIATLQAAGRPACVEIALLCPPLARLLALRARLGVRNSAHSLVKLLQPYARAALRLAAYTHPEYARLFDELLRQGEVVARGSVLLARASEGEFAAGLGRAQRLDWYHPDAQSGARMTTLVHPHAHALPQQDLPGAAAQDAAAFTHAVLAGVLPMPANLAEQIAHILLVSRQCAA